MAAGYPPAPKHQHPSRGPRITTPAAIGVAIGLQGGEVVRLLTRRQWREGDIATLKATAHRRDRDFAGKPQPAHAGEEGPMTSVPVPAAAISDRRLRRASAPCTKRSATLQSLTPQYPLPAHRQLGAPLLNEARIAESDADRL
jgi:hypothetical protein